MLRAGAIVLSMAVALPPATVADVSRQTLLSAWESNWSAVNDLQVSFEETVDENAANQEEGAITFEKATLRWNGAQWFARSEFPASGVTHDRSFDFFAGTGMLLISAPTLPRPHGNTNIDDPAPSTTGIQWLTDLLHAPGIDADQIAVFGDYACLSGLLADCNSRLRAQTEAVDGRTAAVLDAFRESNSPKPWITVWMDLERNAVPLQWTLFDEATGAVRFACRLTDYTQLGGNVWLPRTVLRCQGPGFPDSGMIAARRVCEIDGVAQIRVNQGLSAADCTVQFPSGAMIGDNSTHKWYVVQPDGTWQLRYQAFASATSKNKEIAVATVKRGSYNRISLMAG